MAGLSAIEWTEATWNPVTGCSKISIGCANCYAARFAKRLQAMGQPNYRRGFRPTVHEHTLTVPLRWKKPRTIFVNSMSDLFHEKVPRDFIRQVFEVMRAAPQHCYQVLTKRSERLSDLSSELPWEPQIWVGVSVETIRYTHRIDDLRMVPAAVRFISLEPLLGPLPDLDLTGIDWVIAGGESGPGARAMKREWVEDIRDQCLRTGVPFFFKQWGGTNKKRAGRLLGGRLWDQRPTPHPRACAL